MSKVIALTGGIGSGKTFVASIFQKLAGIPCFCSDLEAKKIMNAKASLFKIIIYLPFYCYYCFLCNKIFINEYIKGTKCQTKFQVK